MSKYYYVTVSNPWRYGDTGSSYYYNFPCKNCPGYETETETGKLFKDIVMYSFDNEWYEYCNALLSVKAVQKEIIVRGFLGIKHKEVYYEYRPFPIICEEKDGYLIEVITGNKYEREESWHGTWEFSQNLKFFAQREVSASEVKQKLEGLTCGDISRFRNKMYELERAVYDGYQKDMAVLNCTAPIEPDTPEDAYIKSFRNR